jgi:N-acetylglucosamine malate deacetylase 2
MYRFLFLLILIIYAPIYAQQAYSPSVLIVMAHPDDETTFPVAVYKITQHLKGTADLFVITDGQGGFRGSELGSEYYKINLTDSLTASAYLPAIRKQELMNAGKIMGIRNYYFMDQPDDGYSSDPEPYLTGKKWDTAMLEKRLGEVLSRQAYDFVFILLPHQGQHAHHKAASILALRVISAMPAASKPIILGAAELTKKNPIFFRKLEKYPETEVSPAEPVYQFDRTTRFGYDNQLTYRIIADWVYAEYKSQGGLQESEMHHDELEVFWYFAINGKDKLPVARQLFHALANSGHPGSK